MAARHAPLYLATYKGPLPVVWVGEGPAERGYPAGSTIQIGKSDADAIRKLTRAKDNQHEFELEQVSTAIIGTAEQTQPTSPHKARELHQRLLKHSHDIEIEIGEA